MSDDCASRHPGDPQSVPAAADPATAVSQDATEILTLAGWTADRDVSDLLAGWESELLQKGGPLPPQEPWKSAPNVGTW